MTRRPLFPMSAEQATTFERLVREGEAGDGVAACRLGDMYREASDGVRYSPKAARRWYARSALAGNPRGQNNLGACYEHGVGCNQSYQRAARWYRRAAAQDLGTATMNLGYCHLRGKGVAVDKSEAVRLFRLAVVQGEPRASEELARLGEVSVGRARVVRLLEPFSQATSACAAEMLANAMFVLAELPNVRMSDELRSRTKEICRALIGTKHDLITEVFDLDDLVSANGSDEQICQRVERIVRWAREDLMKLRELVTSIDVEQEKDPLVGVASVLVMESAANIVKAFRTTQRAAVAALRELRPLPLPAGLASRPTRG